MHIYSSLTKVKIPVCDISKDYCVYAVVIVLL